ncbi:FkbM family methyltransferase [Thermomonospora umbrina]|uniref:FkbM family methyltransferase n=1 Tax=Thermomonospora umbrina TaxID=111806 RepID=A0A3D9T393_9ACTN|nr:FkbM family methyltransferase [Thermomonospora umbrina]REF00844.1 FkbM family methyltransferase [Thermomonospora umbrina]
MTAKGRRAKAGGELGLHYINSWEASYLAQEVEQYFSHGIGLQPGATVVDVGANIGVFSAHVYQLLNGDVRVYAGEPLPPIYATLEKNARERLGGKVTALPYGFSSRDEELEFTYFPLATILSSTYRDKDNVESEQRRIASSIVDFVKEGHAGAGLKRVPAFVLRLIVGWRVRGLKEMQTHRVRVRPLSDVIDEHGIDRIDLLKIDVEGAESDVLRGIEERHWPLVRQAVVEVEGWRENHAAVEEFFTSRKYDVTAVPGVVESSDIGMIYAIAPSDA